MPKFPKIANRTVALAVSVSAIFLNGCFKEDDRYFPPPPGDARVFTFQQSIYDHHSYFDFSADSVTLVVPNDTWQIEFGTSPKSGEIRVNSSSYYQVYPTGDTTFNPVTVVTDPVKYIFDTSGGHPDSCAFSSWIDRSILPGIPTRQVFLVGQYDGIKVNPRWKIRIDRETDSSFVFTWSSMPKGETQVTTLLKDPTVNYLQFDFYSGAPLKNEPPSDQYDVLFTQYGTILYDNAGVATPYFVRGILLNPSGVEASSDSIHNFSDITWEMVNDYPFSAVRDVIGHEWKDVKVDPDNNTAEYFVNTTLTWIIKDTEGFLYKMRFLEFYNSEAEPGYTTIEYQRL